MIREYLSLIRISNMDGIDTVRCSVCSLKKERSFPFISLAIDVPDEFDNAPSSSPVSLNSLLHPQPQVLDDESWKCDCGENASPLKTHSYDELPTCLVVNLKRIRFDPVSGIEDTNS